MRKNNAATYSTGLMGLILACFFFSGLTGLTYEILWTRMIVKVIGAAPFAVAIVLTVFMGGLGLGSYIASGFIDRIGDGRKMVRLYGVLELAIGAYCLILPTLLGWFKPLYSMMYNRLFEQVFLYNFLTFVGCTVLLILPVICMGMTLPVLCRFYVTRLSHLGGHVGKLYGLNTIGAAAGALLCGFWLIAALGMTGTLIFAVAANVLIGAVAIWAGYKLRPINMGRVAPKTTVESGELSMENTHGRGAAVAALLIFAISGFCSMSYEVIWSKLLGLLIGPTTYSFTIILVTFITGLALGSMLFGWLGDRVKKPIWLLIFTQFAAGILAMLVSQLLGGSQFFFAKLIYTFNDNFATLSLLKGISLFIFMLGPTLCLGATFPLVGKIYTESLGTLGRSVGRAYAINTIGAVLGSFCAGFILVPYIGKEDGLRLVMVIQVASAFVLGLFLVLRNRPERMRLVPLIVLAIIAGVLSQRYPKWDRENLAVGRYHRQKELIRDLTNAGWVDAILKGDTYLKRVLSSKQVYYGDGIAGFTVVDSNEDAFGNVNYTMIISGKPDASSYRDMPTQTLSAHIPMLFHPNAKDVMVLGLASGVTCGEVLCYPVDRLDALEISPEVIEASDFFRPWNHDVVDDPRTHVILQDGRAHLALTNQMYDVIISEPSNPWMAGLAALFTEDMFDLAKGKLRTDGIFVQFIHSYQMDWPSFAMVCRTFKTVFPNSAMMSTMPGDYILMGFNGDKGLDYDSARRNITYARTSKNIDLRDARLLYRALQTEDLMAMTGEGPINSDAWPHLEFAAPRALFTEDVSIGQHILAGRRMTPESRRHYNEVVTDGALQVDFARMVYSVNYIKGEPVNLKYLDDAQKAEYLDIVTTYAADNEIDYEVLPDPELANQCRRIQIAAIEANLPTSGNKPLAYYTVADLYRQLGRLPKAEHYYRLALELRPDHAPLHNDLAVVLHYQGKLTEAIAEYDEAIRLDRYYEAAFNNRQKAVMQLQTAGQ